MVHSREKKIYEKARKLFSQKLGVRLQKKNLKNDSQEFETVFYYNGRV